jgi:hypothetical protein
LIAAAFVGVASPAFAQPMPVNMPGMTMHGHTKAQPAKPKSKAAAKKKPANAAARKPVGKKSASPHHATTPIKPSNVGAPPMDHGSMQMPAPKAGTSSAPPMDHSQMDHGPMTKPMNVQPTRPAVQDHAMGHMQVSEPAQGHASMKMGGALGPYPMQREASGTAWQPDTSEHMGLMKSSDRWMLMAHGVLNLVFDHQSGPRGDDKAFASGMLMGMARRPLGNGSVQFKAMVSPDPLMGASGYPLLLASGETANGRDRLIDRQHPHDLFMELSASASQNIGQHSSVFLYAGLPGEPAFGPPAFMHREAILDSPEAPISHHWLDSTHISFGVVTAGVVLDRFKVEVSRFNGREPDQHRWDIETAPLDSTAVRLSWNPTQTLSLQGSWGHFVDPEQLEPGVDQKRLSFSALYAREIGSGWKFAGTLAWGRKTVEPHNDDAYVAEASLKHDAWTVFGRGEATENRELLAGVEHGPAFRVAKASFGAVRDFRIAEHLSVGAGGLFAVNFMPSALAPLYGGRNPTAMMGFLRLRLN